MFFTKKFFRPRLFKKQLGGVILVLVLLAIFARFARPTMADDTIGGVVLDSLTGEPIDSVRVTAVSPACSTFTNADGRFVLLIPLPVSVSGFNVFQNKKKDFFLDIHNFRNFRIKNMQGRDVSSAEFANGIFFAVFKGETLKILNVFGDLRRFYLSRPEFGPGQLSFSKAAASSYFLIFFKEGYEEKEAEALAGSDLKIELLPMGAIGNINITVNPVGELDVTTHIIE